MSEKTSGSVFGSEQGAVDTYSAYLVARATGRPPVTKGRTATVGEQYAVALGVEHFFKGSPTMTGEEVLDRTAEAWSLPEKYLEKAEETKDLGPSPPDPGTTKTDPRAPDLLDVEDLILRVKVRTEAIQQQAQRIENMISCVDLSPAAVEKLCATIAKGILDTPVGNYRKASQGADLGPSPPDPGVTASPLAKLAAALDPNSDRRLSPEEVVDLAIHLIESADERVTAERAACVEWIRKWAPTVIPEILANQIQYGQHRAP